jgi:hypothetical protein
VINSSNTDANSSSLNVSPAELSSISVAVVVVGAGLAGTTVVDVVDDVVGSVVPSVGNGTLVSVGVFVVVVETVCGGDVITSVVAGAIVSSAIVVVVVVITMDVVGSSHVVLDCSGEVDDEVSGVVLGTTGNGCVVVASCTVDVVVGSGCVVVVVGTSVVVVVVVVGLVVVVDDATEVVGVCSPVKDNS